MNKKPSIGRAESEVLRFIAERGGASVTEVGDHLAETKGQTRNTALNMMERLRQKGFLDREKVDGVFRYRPSATKGTLFENFVDDFVQSVLGGSVSPLVAYLGNRADVDERQLEELRQLVKSLENDRDA
jgi:predicted transcriptional regulator